MFISKVQIYPSLYGMEQMKKDQLYGPPQDLFTNKKVKKYQKKSKKQ